MHLLQGCKEKLVYFRLCIFHIYSMSIVLIFHCVRKIKCWKSVNITACLKFRTWNWWWSEKEKLLHLARIYDILWLKVTQGSWSQLVLFLLLFNANQIQANSENVGPPLDNKFDLEVGKKVTVKVTTWYRQKALVTKNTHVKYQNSTCNSTKVMANVKVFVTDRRQTDRWMRFNVPALSRKRGTKMALLI